MKKFAQNRNFRSILTAFCYLAVLPLIVVSIKANGANNPQNDCVQKRATLTRVTNELKTTRRILKQTEIEAATKQKELRVALNYAEKTEIGRQAVGKDTYKRKVLDKIADNANASVRFNERKAKEVKAKLAKQKSEELYWVNQLHLIRDYVDANCAAVPKPQPKPAIPNIAGNYNSPYGKTVLTQQKTAEGVFITATVYYDGKNNSPSSGTSTLKGFFDGKTWRFNWRNSLGHHGTGVMGYNADESLRGYWINAKDKTRGNWWLRPR